MNAARPDWNPICGFESFDLGSAKPLPVLVETIL